MDGTLRYWRRGASVVAPFLISAASAPRVAAQDTPLALAKTVVARWATGSATEFAAVYPFREGQDALSTAILGYLDRQPGLAAVIRSRGDDAVLLLSGVPVGHNSGDNTTMGRGFSGVYEAKRDGDRWKLTNRIPLEDMGQILAHHIEIWIVPASGFTSQDRMRIQVRGQQGIALRLNANAKIESISTTRDPSVRYLFGGGLLWLDLPAGATELTVKYSMTVDEGPNNTNSGSFLPKAGHLRTSYFWHPFFDFNSAGDQADFHIKVHIPKSYEVTTSIPQQERVAGSERIVVGQTVRPTSALTLAYDRNWIVSTDSLGGARLQLFVTPAFRPDAQAIKDEFEFDYTLLSQRFGRPHGSYLGIVEARSLMGGGWLFESNEIVVAAGWPRVMFARDTSHPRAYLGHEISHMWTRGSGPAANFLQEGWATYAESVILDTRFGPSVVKTFWSYQSEDYFHNLDGNASLMEDENNGRIAYSKGAWVFRMLEEAVGTTAFEQGIAEYSRRSLQHPAGWEVLADCVQSYAPKDFDARAFLLPWVTGKSAPHLVAEISGDTVTVRQEPPYFDLPVTIEVSTAHGPERRALWIKSAQAAVAFAEAPTSVVIDPDHALLLRR